uniref:MFS transporter n=1 Tax=uncultured Sphingomonas sp. TaxID=158754 RepID=UPI0035CBEF20
MTPQTDPSRLARQAPVGIGFKLRYGSGGVIDGITTASLTYFLLFYLTTVCGLSGTLAGTALLVGLLIDAVADPLVGLLSDNTRSSNGRRFPYMFYSTIPLALLFGMLFSIPGGFSGTLLLVYAGAMAMALRITISVFLLPYVAVGAEVTDDYVARSSIVTWRICFNMIGTFLAIGLGLGVFMAGPDGLLHRAGYVSFGWTCAAIIVLAGMTAAFATKRVLPRLHAVAPSDGPIVRRFLRELGEVFRNRSFVVLFGAVTVFFVAQGAAGALALYLNRYFWNLSSSAVQIVLIGATLGPFVGAPLTAFLARFFEKKTLTIVNFIAFILAQAWPPLAHMAGFLTGPNAPVMPVLLINALCSGAALVGVAIGAQSMMADATDEHEHRFGVRREALYFSGLTLAVKAASGLGGFIAGVALDVIHFPTAQAAKGGSVALAPDVIRNLGLASGPLPASITLLAPLILLGYTLSRHRHAAILRDLAERRFAS